MMGVPPCFPSGASSGERVEDLDLAAERLLDRAAPGDLGEALKLFGGQGAAHLDVLVDAVEVDVLCFAVDAVLGLDPLVAERDLDRLDWPLLAAGVKP